MRAFIVAAVLLLAGAPAATAESVTYRWPQAERDDARDCYRTERIERGIPGETAAYVEWWNANEGSTARADWSAAYEACQARYLTTSPWDRDAMERVS